MNQYQKVATAVLHSRGASLTADQLERWGGSIWYAGFGLVMFLLGRPLGRLVGRGLD
jgi:hypothetical protein